MKETTKSPSPYAITMKKNTRILGLCTFGWTLTVALVTLGHMYLWNDNTLITSMALGLNLIAGVGLIVAHIRHLRGMDEMQQRVQLNAMGIALGVTLVLGMFYTMLDQTDIISGHADISFLIIVMGFTYMISLAVGNRQYQ